MPPITSGQMLGSDLYARQLDVNGTQLDVVNTTTDTVIYTYVLGGGILTTNGGIQLRILGTYLNNSGAGRTFNLTVNYGGTTMYKDTSGSFAAGTANRAPIEFDFILTGGAATNSQVLTGWDREGDRFGGATTGIGDLATAASSHAFGGVASVDSTINQTLEVKLQHSAANANLSFQRNFTLLTKIGH